MSTELLSIKNSYEVEGMTVEEISLDRGLDGGAVKAALMQCSAQYRAACGKEEETKDELNFDDDQLKRINEVIVELALSAEDPHLRFKAASYIRDDKKGRKDVVKGLAGQQFNILYINEQMKKVREVTNSIKQSVLGNGSPKVINV